MVISPPPGIGARSNESVLSPQRERYAWRIKALWPAPRMMPSKLVLTCLSLSLISWKCSKVIARSSDCRGPQDVQESVSDKGRGRLVPEKRHAADKTRGRGRPRPIPEPILPLLQ